LLWHIVSHEIGQMYDFTIGFYEFIMRKKWNLFYILLFVLYYQ
jgi:hypothetical protein